MIISINERTTPSVVIFDNKEKIYVGEEVIYRVWREEKIKIYEIKRIIKKNIKELKI